MYLNWLYSDPLIKPWLIATLHRIMRCFRLVCINRKMQLYFFTHLPSSSSTDEQYHSYSDELFWMNKENSLNRSERRNVTINHHSSWTRILRYQVLSYALRRNYISTTLSNFFLQWLELLYLLMLWGLRTEWLGESIFCQSSYDNRHGDKTQ